MALLQMVSLAVGRMQTAVAASHAEALWSFLLHALDARQQHPGPSVHLVEAAATELLVKVTLKLSEARFKPLFLRLLDWAATPPTLGETLTLRYVPSSQKWLPRY